MRVCPNCKHHDLPIWRNSRYYFNVDIASFSDIEFWDSRLASEIKDNVGYFEDGHFAYLLQSGGTRVLRKEIELLNKDTEGNTATARKEKWFQIAIEKHRRKHNPNQRKLFVTDSGHVEKTSK